MEFVTPWMLLGILSVSIPVIIHLLNRKSARTVEWGAFLFLMDSLMKRRRRVLLEEMLLLACRCLLLALLALALARPFIQPGSQVPWAVVLPMLLLAVTLFGVSFAMWRYPKWRRGLLASSAVLAVLALGAIALERHLNLVRFGHGAQRDVVLVIDGSSSMTMRQGAESNFERALAEAETYIQNASRGTAFGLIVGGPVPQVMTPVPITDRRELLALLDELRPAQGTMQMMGTLTASAVCLASGSNPTKQIVVIGDGQAIGWHLDSPERWKVMASILEQLPSKPQIVWRTLPLPASIRNAALVDLALSRDVVGTDREVDIRVSLMNTGSEAVTPQEVTLKVGETTLSNRSVNQLEGGASQTVTFRHRFTQPGAHVVTATVVADDDLPADDSATRVVHVIDALNVLVVDGNPSGLAFDRGSAYLSLALRPETQEALDRSRPAAASPEPEQDAERGFLVKPEVIDAPRIGQRDGFADCGVVILADVPRLPDAAAERLARFVSQGGGLLIAPGARAQPDFYNRWAFQGETVLPLPLLEFAAAASETNRPSLAPTSFTHEALRNLRTGSDLGRVLAARWWRMDEGPAAVRVAGRFDNGDPFLAVRRFGRGTVALTALPFDLTASELPSRGSFVPLVHELAYHLANPTVAELNLQPTEGATLLMSAGGRQGAPEDRGLQGAYYTEKGFRGRMFARIDPQIDFRWGGGSPMPKIPSDRFSVRWSGSLLPRDDGSYRVWAEADDQVAVWLNGRQAGRMDLKGGERYDLLVEFNEDQGEAMVRLLWESDRLPASVIPQPNLSPVRPLSNADALAGEPTEIEGPNEVVFNGKFVQTEEGVALRIARSLVPGLYHVRVPEILRERLAPVLADGQTIPFSVVSGIGESELAAMTSQELDFLRDHVDLLTATQEEDVRKALVGETFGKEIWRMLAYAALLLMMLEIFLTRWIAIQRRTGEEETVAFEEEAPEGSASFQQHLDAIRNL